MEHLLDIRPEVAEALANGQPVVALESTLISHGLPRPTNLETARAAEAAVRAAGAIPATIAILSGRPTVGLTDAELEQLALRTDVLKASRRDLGHAVAGGLTAATTVAGTVALAYHAGISVFATGGIGGVHRPASSWDVSADLYELGRTSVAVICSGAKNILDIPRTLELLESLGVPVAGYACDAFPGFIVGSTGEPLQLRIDSPAEAAKFLSAHWELGGAGVVIARQLEDQFAMNEADFASGLAEAEKQAELHGVRGPAVTPFLLSRLAELTAGRSLAANRALIVANAGLAAEIAGALTSRSASG